MFEIGTIVRLKSGGPEMTCTIQVLGNQSVECQWFVGDEVKCGSFPVESLEVVDKSESKKNWQNLKTQRE